MRTLRGMRELWLGGVVAPALRSDPLAVPVRCSIPRRCPPCRTARSRFRGTSRPAWSCRSPSPVATGNRRASSWPAAHRALGFVAPGVGRAVEAPAGGELPFGLRGEPLAGPGCVGARVLVGDVHDRMIPAAVERGQRAFGAPPACARQPRPPLVEVAEVDRARRGRETRATRAGGSPPARPGSRRGRVAARRRSRTPSGARRQRSRRC